MKEQGIAFDSGKPTLEMKRVICQEARLFSGFLCSQEFKSPSLQVGEPEVELVYALAIRKPGIQGGETRPQF